MKNLIIVLFLTYSFNSFCQSEQFDPPNYTNIKKAITQNDSNLYYDSLFDRYLAGDSTMTLIDAF